jgi:hypothetical protein
MPIPAKELIDDFIAVAALAGMPISTGYIRHESVPAPHKTPKFPKGTSAVYVFSLASDESVVLKVGKVGPKSGPRFVSQHYIPKSSRSNLAKSVLTQQSHWQKLGISIVEEAAIGEWIRANTTRDHFYLKGSQLTHLLEAFLQCRLNPLFEGAEVRP